MSLTKKLIELQQIFLLYQPLWEDWTKTPICTLNSDEHYILSVHIQNNFRLADDNLFMFYFQYKEIVNLTNKLHTNYPDFQEWAVIKFQFSLVKLASRMGWAYGYYVDIESLQIAQELKTILKKFNCHSINDLGLKYSDEVFKRAELFNTVKEFLHAYSVVSRTTNGSEKEVA